MKLLVCAIEPSANIHLKELKKHLNDIEFVGIFDKTLGNPIYDLSSMAIMGFVDVVSKIPLFFSLKSKMVDLSQEADKVLLIDSSGFNLPLSKAIKEKYPNKEIIYYILPQAWAWKRKRIQKIEMYCDKLCSILPFEKDYYTQKDKISYVGHPLLDEITTFKTNLSDKGKIAFLPGSRKNEIKTLLPIYKEIASLIEDKEKILVIPKHFDDNYIEELYGDISMFVVSKDTHQTLVNSEFAFVCSGTATLESALIGTPFVLSYIAKPLDYFIAKQFVKMPYFGLANIFFQKMGDNEILHQEYIQDDVTVSNLLKEYNNMDRLRFLQKSKQLRKYLQNGSSLNVAKIIMDCFDTD